jgi:hypothetical protein
LVCPANFARAGLKNTGLNIVKTLAALFGRPRIF